MIKSQLSPAFFFDLSFPLFSKKKRPLPDLSLFFGGESFATFWLTWSPRGLRGTVEVSSPFQGPCSLDFRKKESIELFVDTRKETKTTIVNRFCHHFVFLPEMVDGIGAFETTKIRFEESRPLASSELLLVSTRLRKSGYEMEIEIPKEALCGYDPESVTTLGIGYRVNRLRGLSQCFPLPFPHFSLEKHPDLWASAPLSPSC